MIRRTAKRIPGLTPAARLAKSGLSVVRGWGKRASAKSALADHVIRVSGYKNVFTGYYDHSPFNPEDESLLLVHATQHPAWRKPSVAVPVSILLIDWRNSRIIKELGRTFSWNWQQGARALWIDAATVAFNVYDSTQDAYRARLVRVDGTVQEELPIPVQEYDRNGFIYGISYEALYNVRPDYGYRNRSTASFDLNSCALESYELKSGIQRTLVTVEELVNDAMKRHQTPAAGAKINHVMAAPGGGALVFLFRYRVHGRRITDLYLLSTENAEYSCLFPDCGASHGCWLDDTGILVTMNGPEGFGYYKADVKTAAMTCVMIGADGHPVALGNDHFIADTYPDSCGLRRLFLAPIKQAVQTTELGAFAEPFLFQGETRCDLHPSVSSTGNWVQVDCALGHQRCVAVLPSPLRGNGR